MIDTTHGDVAILAEIGTRLERARIDADLTQADLARQAGISKRTVERVEAGADAQFSSIIRILRVLKLIDGLNSVFPEVRIRPMDALRMKGKARKRVRHTKVDVEPKPWEWGDD